MYLLDTEKIELKKQLSTHLSLRDSANQLFDAIEMNQCNKVELDFKGVQTISRSFAQQFLSRIQTSDKEITYVNETNNIKMMFDVVEAKGEKPVVINSKKNTVVNLSSVLH